LKVYFRKYFENWLAGLALLGLGFWLLWRLTEGKLNYYIHPRFNLLVLICGVVLLGLSGWVFARRTLSGKGLTLTIILLALTALIGLTVLPQPLQTKSQNLANRPYSSQMVTALNNRTSPADTQNWNLLDWYVALGEPTRAEQLLDSPVNLVGLVVTANSNTFTLGRYVVWCCTADSNLLRLPVQSPLGSELKEGQWVRVQGSLIKTASGSAIFSAAKVELIDAPAQPYIYP
jgi:uncharacterized repeat protein (TIGR03943 family)